MYASSRTTWPSMARARLEIPNHDRITRSARTAPVDGSTFCAPKKWRRAVTDGLAAPAPAGQAAASMATQTIKPSRVRIRGREYGASARLVSEQRRAPRAREPAEHRVRAGQRAGPLLAHPARRGQAGQRRAAVVGGAERLHAQDEVGRGAAGRAPGVLGPALEREAPGRVAERILDLEDQRALAGVAARRQRDGHVEDADPLEVGPVALAHRSRVGQ